MLKELENYQEKTDNELLNTEQAIYSSYVNYSNDAPTFREAMRDLLDHEFTAKNCYEDDALFFGRNAFSDAQIICYEDGTFLLTIKIERILEKPKIENKEIDSFNDLLEEIKDRQLLVSDIENMQFLTFKQVKQITTIFDIEKELA